MLANTPRLLHISFVVVFLSPEEQTAIEEILSAGMDWIRYGSNCWLLYTTEDSRTWTQRLTPIDATMRGSFGFLVVEVNNYAGLLDKHVWEWLKRS